MLYYMCPSKKLSQGTLLVRGAAGHRGAQSSTGSIWKVQKEPIGDWDEDYKDDKQPPLLNAWETRVNWPPQSWTLDLLHMTVCLTTVLCRWSYICCIRARLPPLVLTDSQVTGRGISNSISIYTVLVCTGSCRLWRAINCFFLFNFFLYMTFEHTP